MIRLAIFGVALTLSLSTVADGRNSVEREVFKVSPKEILHLRKVMDERKAARQQDLRERPTVLADVSTVELSPGEAVPEIFLYPLNPTAISFVDITGHPWPIDKVEAVDGGLVSGKIIENGIGNVAQLHPVKESGFAYVSIYLKELAKPVYVAVTVSSNQYHREKTIKLTQIGPETEISTEGLLVISKQGLEDDEDLGSVLYNVAPYNAKRIKVDRKGVDAFKKGDSLLVRTRLNIFSPQVVRVESAQNGILAYRLPFVSPIYATDETKRVVKITVSE